MSKCLVSGEGQSDLPTTPSFIFSPPMTRQRTRRMSLTPGESSHDASLQPAISLLPPLPETGSDNQEVQDTTKQTPAKRPRRKAKTIK